MGVSVGVSVGFCDGRNVGVTDGAPVKTSSLGVGAPGVPVGAMVGEPDGGAVGVADGKALGAREGWKVGAIVGSAVG